MNTPDYWLNVLLECNRLDFTPATRGAAATPENGGPTLSSRSFAIALRAMAHAWFLERPGVASLGFPAVPNRPAAPDAASALHGAAARILSRLFPKQTARIIQAAQSAGPADVASANWGRAVADAHFASRSGDTERPAALYTYQSTPGAYQPDPQNPAGNPFDPKAPGQPHGVDYGRIPLFGLGAMLPLDPPPGYQAPGQIDRTDSVYLADYAKVRASGHRKLTEDTANPAGLDNALRGIFWAYDGVAHLGTPPRLYFQIIEKIAAQFGLSNDRKMLLYAICGTALGDAGVHAWHYKYLYNIWRPVTGIRQHGASFGAAGTTVPQPSSAAIDGDPFWEPLGAPNTNGVGENFTPPFPAYPSGHATFGGASLHALRVVLNAWDPAKVQLKERADAVSFTFVSDELNGINQSVAPHAGVQGAGRTRHERQFASLEEAIMENGLSRVFLGVHWQFDAEPIQPKKGRIVGGVPLGISIADALCAGYAPAIAAV
jgi:membrane-associated phospholipid phosphatase